MELWGAGVIVNASTGSSVVRIPFNNDVIDLTFTKDMLYSFGVKCEGDMTNIIEQGMRVNLVYNVDRHQSPYIVTVWIGEKPKDTSSLKHFFDQWGHLSEVKKNVFFVECDNFERMVLVKKSVVYRDKYLLDEKLEPAVNVGKHIIFDAVPLLHKHESDLTSHLPVYTATCAWIGEDPRLVDRFGLAEWNRFNDDSEKDLHLQGRDVEGTVTVIPNDTVAFVDVDVDDVVVKVLLFRSCFGSDQLVANNSLTDMVAPGDALNLKIRRGCLYSGLKQWFATKAWKHGDEIPVDGKETCPEKSDAEPWVELERESDLEMALERREGFTRFPFLRGPAFTGRLRFLQSVGVLTPVEVCQKSGEIEKYFTLKHPLGFSARIDNPVVHGLESIDWHDRVRDVWFDAVIDDASEKLQFQVERMWKYVSKDDTSGNVVCRAVAETLLEGELSYHGKEKLTPFELHLGTIKSIPLYDCAIVYIGEIPVLVTLESLATDEKINQSYTSIDLFLKVGEEVLLIADKADSHYRATECWSFHDNKTMRISSDCFSNGSSSFSIQSWKSDDYYGRSLAMWLGTAYYVEFVTPPHNNLRRTVALDIFANNRVFIDGRFISSNEADVLLGREVYFYVAYSPEKENEDTPYGLYVAYAWAGDRSVPWAALDDRLSVPKDVLRSGWFYEAIVECLPESNRRGVPQHIVCSIGPLPVLVPNIDGAENKFVQGERVCLCVQEITHETETAFVADSIGKMPSFSYVLNLKGTVTSSPKPFGLIESVCGVLVVFAFCQVQDRAIFGCNGEELSEWFKRVSKATRVGATVYFSARRKPGPGRNFKYHALEVWPSEE